MPGGNAYQEQSSAGPDGKTNILNFISAGGLYVGTCAGYYYAADGYWWEADRPDGGEYKWPNTLGIFPEVEGSISNIIDDEDQPGYKLTRIDNGLHAIYWGGPTRGWRRTPSTVPGTVLARFADVPGALPAAVHVNDKDGNRLLFSAHFEAEEGVGIRNTGLTPAQTLANWQYRAQQINSALGVARPIAETLPHRPADTPERAAELAAAANDVCAHSQRPCGGQAEVIEA